MAGLKASLREFGDLSGITYNTRTKTLICAHQRRQALLELYGDTFTEDGDYLVAPNGDRFHVRRVDWPKKKADAANVAANSPFIAGTWTPDVIVRLDAIKVEMPELFTELRLDVLAEDIAALQGNGAGDIKEDPIPDPPKKAITKKGDLWILGRHRVLCGDATSEKDVARVMGGEKLFLMVTDPPYGVNYDPEWREGADLGVGKRNKGKVANDDRIDWHDAFVLFAGDVVYVWHASQYAVPACEALEKCDFEIRSQLIWAKQHFALSRGHYHWQHEPCWYAVKKKATTAKWCGDRKQTTVWQIANNNAFGGQGEEKYGHGTQKPVECMARPIRNHEGNVYDPFLGSGTTLIAAEQLGRRCFGLEIEPKYCDVIVERWQNLTGEKARKE